MTVGKDSRDVRLKTIDVLCRGAGEAVASQFSWDNSYDPSPIPNETVAQRT